MLWILEKFSFVCTAIVQSEPFKVGISIPQVWQALWHMHIRIVADELD